MAVYKSVIDLIGDTPIIDVSALSPNPRVRILGKLEGQNPAGSVKDRIARAMIAEGEADGTLTPGRTIIEPSSGNTGIALAMICQLKGYPLKIVLPENVSIERRQLLEVFGAEIILSPGDEGSNGAVRPGPGAGRGAPRVGVPLPVRQRGQPPGPLRDDRSRDPARRPRHHPLRRRARHQRHADGRRHLPQGAEARREGARRRAAVGRAGRGPAQPRRRLHPARVREVGRPRPARRQADRAAPRVARVDPPAGVRGRACSPASRRARRSPARPSWPSGSTTGTIVFIICDAGWKYLSTGAYTDDLDAAESKVEKVIYF